MSKQPPMGAGRSDIFQTEDEALDCLLPHIPVEWRIWECAAGKGQMVKKLEAEGYAVKGTDALHGFDFLSPLAATMTDYDCIITNPPYSKKTQWLARCFEIEMPFALLLPITALGEQARVKLYRKYGIQLIMPSKRINFTTPSGKKGGAWFYAAWFCYKLNLPQQITFAD